MNNFMADIISLLSHLIGTVFISNLHRLRHFRVKAWHNSFNLEQNVAAEFQINF